MTNFRVPRLAATIERRLLINYRLDPAVARTILPTGLRPQLVNGSAVAGICLIRMGSLRPAWFNIGRGGKTFGWRGENAAHRIAVEWDDAGGTHTGVYIPERHSASWIPVAIGGRVFPGVHKRARFRVQETDERIRVALTSGETAVRADVVVTPSWSSRLFPTVDDASRFFQAGSVGWSPSRDGESLEGLQLDTTAWQVEPGELMSISSSFFSALPAGSARFDSVLVMRNVPVEWSIPRSVPPMTRGATVSSPG